MPAIGITGGIATGKSTFVRALTASLPGELFDADVCVHRLLASDGELQAAIERRFGAAVREVDGGINRVALRAAIFADPLSRKDLESLIHPRVRAVWLPMAQAARQASAVTYLDIPLIYEIAAEEKFDRVVVVAASPETQKRRLTENRGLAPGLIEGILKAQTDLPAKVLRGNHVVWNDGSPSSLEAQAQLFADYLRDIYG